MIIFIPGFVIATLTFPGVILHEMAHKFFCDLYRVPVFEVKYFAMSKNAGHVIYSAESSAREKAFISLAPLLINSTVCFLFLLPLALPIFMGTSFANSYAWPDFFLAWVGISCGMHALPSKTDLTHIDKKASWPFRFVKRLVQVFNFLGGVGALLWVVVASTIPLVILNIVCLFLGLFF